MAKKEKPPKPDKPKKPKKPKKKDIRSTTSEPISAKALSADII